MLWISKCGLVVVVCALLATIGAVGVNAQSDAEAMLILNQNAADAGDSQLIMLSGPDDATIKALNELETRTVLMPPGPDDMLPVSATAVISINLAGSYVLGGNLFGVAGKHGIEIKKSNVTLDLNGYAVIGTNGSLSGIHVPSKIVNVKIHNGAIRGWPRRGIDAKKALASEISDVRVGNCKWHGIYLGQGIVTGCTSRLNGGDGINIENGMSIVSNCTAEQNGEDGVEAADNTTLCKVVAAGNLDNGIVCGFGCTVNGCTATENTVYGFLCGDSAVVSECAAFENDFHGFRCGSGSTVTACASTGNGGTGISCQSACAVVDCSASGNAFIGILCGSASTISGCAIYENMTFGIACGSGCMIQRCTAYQNGSYGINCGLDGIVESCTVRGNTSGGVIVSIGSVVRGCTVSEHNSSLETGIYTASGHADIRDNLCRDNYYGIQTQGTDCRIEGNNVIDCTVGISVQGLGNVIVGNTSSSTTDYSIVAGNDVGAISTTPVGAGAWDNFEF